MRFAVAQVKRRYHNRPADAARDKHTNTYGGRERRAGTLVRRTGGKSGTTLPKQLPHGCFPEKAATRGKRGAVCPDKTDGSKPVALPDLAKLPQRCVATYRWKRRADTLVRRNKQHLTELEASQVLVVGTCAKNATPRTGVRGCKRMRETLKF